MFYFKWDNILSGLIQQDKCSVIYIDLQIECNRQSAEKERKKG